MKEKILCDKMQKEFEKTICEKLLQGREGLINGCHEISTKREILFAFENDFIQDKETIDFYYEMETSLEYIYQRYLNYDDENYMENLLYVINNK